MTVAVLAVPFNTFANDRKTYADPDTGYVLIIDDAYDSLTEEQVGDLYDKMIPMLQYGNAVFFSTDTNEGTSEDLNVLYYKQFFEEMG